MTQPAQQHAILPAVTFEQTTFLFADILPDPLLDQGLGGAALQGSRVRQVVRQPGPVECNLVHHLRLHFHLLHPAALARATEPGPASDEWRAWQEGEEPLQSVLFLLAHSQHRIGDVTAEPQRGELLKFDSGFFPPAAGQRAARGATFRSIDVCNAEIIFTCWVYSKTEIWTFCYFKEPLVYSLCNHINLRSSGENELYTFSKLELVALLLPACG